MKFLALIFALFLLSVDSAYAQNLNLIVCDGVGDPCDYADLITLAKRLINALVIISTFLAGAVFAYAGLKMLLASGNETEYKKAVTMLKKVGIGYLWILAAWFVVYTIGLALLNPGFNKLGMSTLN